MGLYRLVRPWLFRLDPETAHNLTLLLLRWGGSEAFFQSLLRAHFEPNDPRLEVEAFGLKFKNPVGLAAGYDKNGVALRGLACLGFGHIEVGTVTLRQQAGNPRPRIHRVPEAQALVNSMGFPNIGIDSLRVERETWSDPSSIRRRTRGVERGARVRVGINIGKGKDTPLEGAAEEYCELFRRVHGRADYVALNVSSPNTPGLRQLQSRSAVEGLLRAVTKIRDGLSPRVPLLVKIAPDLNEADIDGVLEAVAVAGVDGVIATNTTVSREGLPDYAVGVQGGLSGAPLRARATEVIRYIARRTEGKLPIVGVGGILCAENALEKLQAGAWLVQVYTGLVYAGPGLVREIKEGLLEACKDEELYGVEALRSVHSMTTYPKLWLQNIASKTRLELEG